MEELTATEEREGRDSPVRLMFALNETRNEGIWHAGDIGLGGIGWEFFDFNSSLNLMNFTY